MIAQKNSIIRGVEKYCGQELRFRMAGALDNLDSKLIKIANTGMVSSGKSSLYNLLTGNTAQERFPTGAARTTTLADSYIYENREFIDTPGIDVKDADNERAFAALMQSDIIMMVHNIKTGPLTRSEVEWLQMIAAGMSDDEMRKQRLLFVCTWKDTREKEDGYAALLAEVKRMVYQTVGVEIPFFDVSVKKHLNGLHNRKSVLCEKSGINELTAYLNQHAAAYASQRRCYAIENYRQTAGAVKDELKKLRCQKEGELERRRAKIESDFKEKMELWTNDFDEFKKLRKELRELGYSRG